jgi:hypothetical protein
MYLDKALEIADRETQAAAQVEPTCEVMRADATAGKKGAGGSRTHDGGFAIRCLSLLATAPNDRVS